MKTLWCWRCQEEVPMLDDEEFAVASKLYGNAFGFGKKGSIEERFQPLVDYYENLTGLRTIPMRLCIIKFPNTARHANNVESLTELHKLPSVLRVEIKDLTVEVAR